MGMFTDIFNKLNGHPAKIPQRRPASRRRRNPPVISSLAVHSSALKPKRAATQSIAVGDSGSSDVAAECCADLVNMMIVCADASDPRNGATITNVGETNIVSGVALVTVTYGHPGGPSGTARLPMCDEVEGGGNTTDMDPVPSDCCFDQALNKLVCGSITDPLNLADVTLESINIVDGIEMATVYVNGDPSLGMRVPLCSGTINCCLDLATGTLICTDGAAPSPFNGLAVSVEDVGQTMARVSHADLPNGFAYVPLCKSELPGDCCFDVATGLIECTDTSNPLHGQSGTVISVDEAAGTALVFVESAGSDPITLPLCESSTGECCFNQDTGLIECTDPNNPLHGTPAGVVTDPGPDANGIHYVEVAWAGGQGRMLLCGESEECPPLYCCVNLDTGNFVCPGIPGLSGSKADVVAVEEVDGWRWAVLADGQMVPVCGQDCPPPEVCPDGLWRSPTGECTIPPETRIPGECPSCPPGWLLDTQTGQCVQCPTCPPPGQCPPCPPNGLIPPWTPPCDDDGECCPFQDPPCCDSCAHGGECEGGCDGEMASNPRKLGPASYLLR